MPPPSPATMPIMAPLNDVQVLGLMAAMLAAAGHQAEVEVKAERRAAEDRQAAADAAEEVAKADMRRKLEAERTGLIGLDGEALAQPDGAP